jgi:hypothetical protein
MKVFALDFLSDFLRAKIHLYQAFQIESRPLSSHIYYYRFRELGGKCDPEGNSAPKLRAWPRKLPY